MATNRNTLFYFLIIGAFLLLKFLYAQSETSSLYFLLKPIDVIVSFLSGSDSIYIANKGFYHFMQNIVIEKSCSGFNFGILCFCLLSFLALKYFKSNTSKLLVLPVALLAAYLCTILVNSFRIFVSMIVQAGASQILSNRPHLILHEIVGVTTNLTFLILIYIITEFFLNKKLPNAKPA